VEGVVAMQMADFAASYLEVERAALA